ncbi:hypothetical protein [Adhaeribacter terreus]|uniref:YARHG domain-containing protein n=1 Tax=Adhaeribacter terreus TaxID=529703 RepID=A0ABW0EAB0_9BACT
MRIKLLMAILLGLPGISFAQAFGKGIYKGQKLPFEICYLTYNDSTIQVEYFYQKSGQIFDYIPAKKLVHGLESSSTKPTYKSTDDSILVFAKKDYYLVKRKGFGKVKVYKSDESIKDVNKLRNRCKLHRFNWANFRYLKSHLSIEEHLIWEKVHSLDLKKYLDLSEVEFDKKLTEAEKNVRNMLN